MNSCPILIFSFFLWSSTSNQSCQFPPHRAYQSLGPGLILALRTWLPHSFILTSGRMASLKPTLHRNVRVIVSKARSGLQMLLIIATSDPWLVQCHRPSRPFLQVSICPNLPGFTQISPPQQTFPLHHTLRNGFCIPCACSILSCGDISFILTHIYLLQLNWKLIQDRGHVLVIFRTALLTCKCSIHPWMENVHVRMQCMNVSQHRMLSLPNSVVQIVSGKEVPEWRKIKFRSTSQLWNVTIWRSRPSREGTSYFGLEVKDGRREAGAWAGAK